MERSTARTFLVMLPTEMKSTPVSAILRMLCRPTPPEASSFRGLRAARLSATASRSSANEKLVQHGNVGTCGDGFTKFRQGLHFDLDERPLPSHRCRNGGAGAGHRLGNRAGRHDMIFLDQHAIEQADAMIMTAADAHRVLLCQAQSGYGFAGVQQPAIGAVEERGQIPHGSRHT